MKAFASSSLLKMNEASLSKASSLNKKKCYSSTVELSEGFGKFLFVRILSPVPFKWPTLKAEVNIRTDSIIRKVPILQFID